MSHSVIRLSFALVLVCPSLVARASDPPKAEPLGPPAPVEPEIALPVIDLAPVLPYERINRYEKWQYFAVDGQGHWRPRVMYSPHGPAYLYNGARYHYAPVRYLNWMTYATD